MNNKRIITILLYILLLLHISGCEQLLERAKQNFEANTTFDIFLLGLFASFIVIIVNNIIGKLADNLSERIIDFLDKIRKSIKKVTQEKITEIVRKDFSIKENLTLFFTFLPSVAFFSATIFYICILYKIHFNSIEINFFNALPLIEVDPIVG